MRLRITTTLLLLALIAMGLAWRSDRIRLQRELDSVESTMVLNEVTICCQASKSYFDENWPKLYQKLSSLSDRGLLSTIPNDQREDLWNKLNDLACKHPAVMRDHENEMLQIMCSFGLEDEVADLLRCHPALQ